ncbi:hypothetical protein Tco_0807025 [Tanacetum coccineum]
MNERCSAILLNGLSSNGKDPRNFTIPCQVLEKHKEAEDLAADHLSRLFPQIGPLKKKRFFSQVKTYFWEEPYAFKLCTDNIMRRCVAGSETLEILAHCHSGPTGGHHSANVTANKVYESGFYWSSVFKDVNDESRLMQLNELAELRDGSYENTRIYKERTKKWHDSRLRGDKDLRISLDLEGFSSIHMAKIEKYYASQSYVILLPSNYCMVNPKNKDITEGIIQNHYDREDGETTSRIEV